MTTVLPLPLPRGCAHHGPCVCYLARQADAARPAPPARIVVDGVAYVPAHQLAVVTNERDTARAEHTQALLLADQATTRCEELAQTGQRLGSALRQARADRDHYAETSRGWKEKADAWMSSALDSVNVVVRLTRERDAARAETVEWKDRADDLQVIADDYDARRVEALRERDDARVECDRLGDRNAELEGDLDTAVRFGDEQHTRAEYFEACLERMRRDKPLIDADLQAQRDELLSWAAENVGATRQARTPRECGDLRDRILDGEFGWAGIEAARLEFIASGRANEIEIVVQAFIEPDELATTPEPADPAGHPSGELPSFVGFD